jgi:hypothetical protein
LANNPSAGARQQASALDIDDPMNTGQAVALWFESIAAHHPEFPTSILTDGQGCDVLADGGLEEWDSKR